MAITFDTIGNGELEVMFNRELRKVGENIMDPNMDPDTARSITISIEFKPDGSGAVHGTYNVKSKLAGARKGKTTFLIGQDSYTGKVAMSEYGVGRPQVAAYEAVSASPPPGPVQDPQEFDQETGEIYQQPGKPIDLRQAAARQ